MRVYSMSVLSMVLLWARAGSAQPANPTEGPPAAGDPQLFVCIGGRPAIGPTIMAPAAATAAAATSSSVPLYEDCAPSAADPARPARTTTNPDFADQTTGAPGQYVLIRMTQDGTTPLRLDTRPDIEQATVTAGDVSIVRQAKQSMDGTKTTFVVPLGDLGVLDNFTLITVRIDFNEDPTTHVTRESYTAYFKLDNKFSFYGVFKTGAGFWIPYGLLATNFHRSNDGIPLAAFPVGLAWGVRYYLPRRNLYIGGSVMFNWAVYGNTQNNMSMMPAASSDVNLQSLAFGAMLDITGYVYVGGAYIADYRSGYKSPGFVAVLGAGPQLLQFLQSAKH